MNCIKRLVVCGLLALTSYATAEHPWPQFGGEGQDFHFDDRPMSKPQTPTKRWQQALGEGMSGVVVHDNFVTTMFLKPATAEEQKAPESERTHREVVVTLDADNGKPVWRHEHDAGWIDSQQAFGGRVRAPQATPAVCGAHIISLGFTGKLHCFDRKSGKINWKKDLVDEHQSVPVQFGFSASPLPLGDRVIVLAGGKGGLLCLDVATGKTIWNYACREASYATPILWKRQNGNQIVFVTRNRMIGVAADDGNPLWEYELPEVGLTNVPTPMVIDNNALLVSGQGIKGTRRISITEEAGEMIANEDWQNDEQFFYCNWIRRDNILWGCDGRLLLAIDLKTGKRLGRFRGFRDANLLQGKTSMLSFDGEGNLTRLAPTENGAKVVAKYSVLEKRCWTPPTPHGGKLYCRGGDQLLCLDLEGGDQRAAVAKSPIRNPMLKLSVGEPIAEKPDPIETIVASFEQGGAEAAWDTYSKLRADDPDNLSFGTRQELAKMADSQGLEKFAKMIRSHMEKDFPDEVKQAKRKPSKDTSIGKNGLVYLEFSIHNTSQETIQAVVKGPEKHPFGYGLPIRPNQPRIEKWPVGTKLYRTHNGIRKEVLLTVEKGFAGRTIELPQQVK